MKPSDREPSITAIILAAGESRRMGRPKMLLPWGESTVLQTVIAAFRTAGIQEILAVTGAGREQIEALIGASAQTVFNPDFASGEMLSSIQAGLRAIQPGTSAVLIGLGDQPQVQPKTIQGLVQAYRQTACTLAVPSYERHRGHPWLVSRERWQEVLHMGHQETMRDFFRAHAQEIHYVEAGDDSVLADLDTPADYRRYRP